MKLFLKRSLMASKSLPWSNIVIFISHNSLRKNCIGTYLKSLSSILLCKFVSINSIEITISDDESYMIDFCSLYTYKSMTYMLYTRHLSEKNVRKTYSQILLRENQTSPLLPSWNKNDELSNFDLFATFHIF